VRKGHLNELETMEQELDQAAASFWGITAKELRDIRQTLRAINESSEFAHASFPAQDEDE
jgi:hypothetical protein